MSKKLIIFLSIVGVCLLACGTGYYFYRNYYLPSKIVFPSPLERVEFPSEPTQYPSGWPEELKFPREFILVDTTSGSLPGDTEKGWSSRMKYEGEPSNAVKKMIAFLEEKGWTIDESGELDSGGATLILQRGEGNGIIVIDADPNNSSLTLITATLFP